jgi:translation elongation factor EF-G
MLQAFNPTRISLLDLRSVSEISRVTSHIYLPVQPADFRPPEIGSFIAWGANCLLLVVDSSQGIDASTINLASEALNNHPMIIAITGLDHERASFDESLAVCQRVFGADRAVVATSLPVLNDLENVQGILNMLTESIQWVNADGDIEEHDLDLEHYQLIEARFDELINALAVSTTDETFAQVAINGDSVDAETLYTELVAATIRCELIPVLPLSQIVGLAELAYLSSDVGVGKSDTWSPFSHCDPNVGIGTVLPNNLVRVWQGTFSSGEYLMVVHPNTALNITVATHGVYETFPGGRVIPMSISPEGTPGATISATGIALNTSRELN